MVTPARINWNGAFSQSFGIRNGVKQGGILSPVLFRRLGRQCRYIDGLIVENWMLDWEHFCWGISLC